MKKSSSNRQAAREEKFSSRTYIEKHDKKYYEISLDEIDNMFLINYWVGKGISKRTICNEYLARSQPLVDAIREDPELQELLMKKKTFTYLFGYIVVPRDFKLTKDLKHDSHFRIEKIR